MKRYIVLHINNKKIESVSIMEKKIDDIIVMEKKEPYSLERDFMDDILPKLRVDAVPNAYLYALYCCWMEEKYPGLKRLILGKNSFLEEVRRLIVFFPEWHVPHNQFRVLDYLDKMEETLFLFGLEEWMQDPHSADPNVKFRLKWKRPLMDGILRTKFKDRPVGRPPKKKCG